MRDVSVDLDRRDFSRKQRNRGEYSFTWSHHGLRAAVGALLLTCFVTKRRHDLLVRARRRIPAGRTD